MWPNLLFRADLVLFTEEILIFWTVFIVAIVNFPIVYKKNMYSMNDVTRKPCFCPI